MTKWKVHIKWDEERESYIVDVHRKWFIFPIDIQRLATEEGTYFIGETYDYYARFDSPDYAQECTDKALKAYAEVKKKTQQKIKQEKRYSFKF